MPYTPVLATLGYIFSPDARRVLLLNRNARQSDAHFGKYNGVGGKLEPDEDVVSGFQREVREETGLVCEALHLAGTISWPGFGKHGEDWFGFIFRVTRFAGIPFASNPEGVLEWVDVAEVLTLPLWDGDRFFLPLIFDFTTRPFHGVMPYRDGKPTLWNVTRISAGPEISAGGS